MIVNNTPDNDSPAEQLCADRWYEFEQTDIAITYKWVVISSPSAVNNSDVEFTAIENKITYVRVPIAGTYCFATDLGNV